jgi:ATP-dependent RNA helicase RhlE
MKDGVNRLADVLRKENISVTMLHSGRTQEKRTKALADFKLGAVRVLVATDLAARGIDIDGVSHVVNYDFPVNPEDYIHRIGRTGRAEHEGEAVSFVPKGDLNLLGILEMAIGQRLPRKKLRGFDYYAKSPALVIPPAKKDWRKRTREREEKPAASTPRKAAKKFPKSR